MTNRGAFVPKLGCYYEWIYNMNSCKLVSVSVVYLNSCTIKIHRIHELMQKITTHPFFSKKGRLWTKFGLDIYEFNYIMNSYKLVSESYIWIRLRCECIEYMNSFKTHPFISNRCNNRRNYCRRCKSTAAEDADNNAAIATGTGTSATAASAVARLADTTVETVTSAAAASDVAAIVTTNVGHSGNGHINSHWFWPRNLAGRAGAAVGMMSATGKVATPAGRAYDTGSDTSTIRAKGHTIFLQGLAAVTAVALSAFTAANVMEGMDGAMVASPQCLSFLLGL
jgi:hypothetical protein